MDKTTLKNLIELAKTCRKAGIKHYKDAQVEFTLTEVEPEQAKRKRRKPAPLDSTDKIETDGLTDEQLLLWSVQDIPTGDEASA